MNCRDYVFLLTSDQLSEASLGLRLSAGLHRLRCSRCRAFTRNDQALLDALAKHQQQQRRAISPPDKS